MSGSTGSSRNTAPESSSGDALERRVLPQLIQLSGSIKRGRLFERAMETAELTVERPGLSVLLTLRMAERPLRVGEIARQLDMAGPHITRQVKELERRRLVHRVPDPHDRRASLIEATEAGEESIERYVQAMFGWFASAVEHWSDTDRHTFGELLTRFVTDLTTSLQELPDEPDAPDSAAPDRP